MTDPIKVSKKAQKDFMESFKLSSGSKRFSVGAGMDPNFLKGITVLHVDDQELYSIIARKAVEANKWDYTYVATGEAAVELYETGRVFDVIFMDLNLGSGMDGYEAVEKIRKIRPSQLFYSSSANDPSVIKADFFKAHLGKIGGKKVLYNAISQDLIKLRITFLQRM